MSGGSGSLGRLDIQPTMELNDGRQYFHTLDQAIQSVLQKGILLPGPPASGYRGEMPADITSLDDEALGTLLTDSSQWIGYIEVQLALADGARKEADKELTYVESKIRGTLRAMGKDEHGVKLSEKDKSDWTEGEPRVIEAAAKSIYCEQVYRITLAIRDKSQRDWESISRRITQRGQDYGRQVRNGSIAGVPAHGGFRRRPA
jgi:hypothetical protein